MSINDVVTLKSFAVLWPYTTGNNNRWRSLWSKKWKFIDARNVSYSFRLLSIFTLIVPNFFANLTDSTVIWERECNNSQESDKIPKHFDNDALLRPNWKWLRSLILQLSYRLKKFNKVSEWWSVYRWRCRLLFSALFAGFFFPIMSHNVYTPAQGYSIYFYCNFITFNYSIERTEQFASWTLLLKCPDSITFRATTQLHN